VWYSTKSNSIWGWGSCCLHEFSLSNNYMSSLRATTCDTLIVPSEDGRRVLRGIPLVICKYITRVAKPRHFCHYFSNTPRIMQRKLLIPRASIVILDFLAGYTWQHIFWSQALLMQPIRTVWTILVGDHEWFIPVKFGSTSNERFKKRRLF